MRQKERSQLFIVFLTVINERLGRRVTAAEPLYNMQAYNGKSSSFGDQIYTHTHQFIVSALELSLAVELILRSVPT